MNRREQFEAVAQIVRAAISDADDAQQLGDDIYEADYAQQIIDVLRPQVTTVAELQALPDEAGLVTEDGRFFRAYMAVLDPLHQAELTFPLTVVWQPEVTA